MTFEEGMIEYEKMMMSRNKSENTIKNVRYTLNVFKNIYNYNNLDDIKANISYDFPNKLKERGIAGTSSNIYLNRVKKFLDFLKMFGYIDNNLGSLITSMPSRDAKVQIGQHQFKNERGEVGRVLTKEEIKLIRRAARIVYPDNPQYALMVEILLICGLRISELLHFKLGNINLQNGMVKLLRKSNNIHEFYLGWPELIDRVRRHCYENNISKADDLLFPRKSDKEMPMPYNTFVGILKKIFAAVDLEYGKEFGGFTTHDFRRTCATTLNAMGLTLDDIRDILGHKDIRTTAGYVKHIVDERKIERQKVAVGQAFYDR